LAESIPIEIAFVGTRTTRSGNVIVAFAIASTATLVSGISDAASNAVTTMRCPRLATL
jgi:hypothetical protein